MTDVLLFKSIVVIAAAATAVMILARMKLPTVLGYLLAGLLIGPHGLDVLAESAETRFLGELGVIFLMFMAGMELSVPAIRQAWRHVVVGGSLQISLTAFAVAAAAMLAGIDPAAAFILGGAACHVIHGTDGKASCRPGRTREPARAFCARHTSWQR